MKCTLLIRFALAPLVSIAGMLFLASPGTAAVMVFNDGGNHIVNTNLGADGSIEVRGTTTVQVEAGAMIGTNASSSISTFDSAHLEMTGGSLSDELFLFNSSTATVSGGHIVDDITTSHSSHATITSVTVDDDLEANTTSIMTVNGGSFDEDVEASGDSTVNIHGGTFQTGTDGANIEASGNAVINIYGGDFGTGHTDSAGYFGAIENGTINFYGGDIAGQPEGLIASGTGKVNVYGFSGQPASINTSGGGVINFHDGSLTNLVAHGLGVQLSGTDGSLASIVAENLSMITIFGTDFKFGSTPLSYGPLPFAAGNLSGILADGTPITNVPFLRNFILGGTRGVIVLAAPVPEPTSMALTALALAGLAVARKRNRE